MNKKTLIILFVLVLCLLGLTFIQQSYACVSVTELKKCWSGNWLDSVTSVTVTLSNGTVVYNDGLPLSNCIDIKGIWQGQSATIAWTDGNGPQTETVGPLYPAGECHRSAVVVTNIINHPTVLFS